MFELRTLGRLSLTRRDTDDDVRSVLAQPKRMALLLHLALARPRGPRPREPLLAMFWPDSDQEKARRSLNQTVYMLRRSMGADAVVTGSDGMLSLGPTVNVDALQFQRAVEEDRLGDALVIYEGDLTPGFHADAGAAFERWLDLERERLRRLAVAAALEYGEALRRAGKPGDASALLWRAREWAPLDEGVVRSLVKVLLAEGDRSGAAWVVEDHERAMAAELEIDVVPNADLRAAVEDATPATVDGALPPPSMNGPTRQAPAPPPSDPARPREVRSGARMAWSGLAVTLAAALGFVVLSDGPTAHPTEGRDFSNGRPSVAVDIFDDRTDDSSASGLTRMAPDWVIHGLVESGLVDVVALEVAARMWDPREQSGAQGGIHKGTATDFLVTGSLYGTPDSLLLRARIIDRRDGTVLGAVEVPGHAEGYGSAVVELGNRVVGQLALHLDPRKTAVVGTTRSPPAYEAYTVFAEGLAAYAAPRSFKWPEVAALFERAASLDTAFVAARLWAVQAWINAGRSTDADSTLAWLEARQDDLTTWERALTAYHRASLSDSPHEGLLAARRLADLSGDDLWRTRRAFAAFYANRPAETVRTLRSLDGSRLHGLSPSGDRLEAEALHRLGRHEEEYDTRAGKDPAPGPGELVPALVGLGRPAEALAGMEAADTLDDPAAASIWLAGARELRVHGRPDLADIAAARAVAAVDRAGDRVTPKFAVDVLLEAGLWERVVEVAEPVLVEYPEHFEILGSYGVALARLGRADEARRVVERLDALPNVFGEPRLHQAGVLAHLGQRDEAIGTLRRAFEENLNHHSGLHRWRLLDPLRGDPSFEILLRPRG